MARQRGHASLARIAQGTVCKLLAEQELKPHKVRYYLERRDPEFAARMSEVLCVYQEVAILRAAEANAAEGVSEAAAAALEQTAPNVAFVSYDEKAGHPGDLQHGTRPAPRSRASMAASRAITNTSGTAR